MQKSNLTAVLFESSAAVYAIIDAAKIEELTTQLLIYEPEYRNLFEGLDAMELEEVSPYLVRLDEKDIFTQWVIDDVYGKDGAIFLQSSYDIESLTSHFRAYLHVSREIEHPETQEIVIQEGVLAYYDPRVFPEWLESIEEEIKLSFLSVMTHCYYEDSLDKSTLYAYTTKGTVESYKLSKESLCV